MWFWIGIIGSVAMALLEAFSYTNVGYWWSLVPAGTGFLAQAGAFGVAADLLSFLGD